MQTNAVEFAVFVVHLVNYILKMVAFTIMDLDRIHVQAQTNCHLVPPSSSSMSASNVIQTGPTQNLAAASSMQDTDPPDASQADRDTWRPTGIPLIKHIPKVARPATFLHEVATHADPPTGLLFSTGEVLRCIRLKEGESATT